jgi:hypothetical protein
MGALPQDRKGENLKVLISLNEEETSEESQGVDIIGEMSKVQIRGMHMSEEYIKTTV